MRQSEDLPLDPEILAELEAIDATLRGEAVDPIHAELAELALLVTADRPVIPQDAARRLDERVSRRFAPGPAGVASPGGPLSHGSRRGPGGSRSWLSQWSSGPVFGAVFAGVAALAIVAVVISGGDSSPGRSSGYLPVAAGPTQAAAGTAKSLASSASSTSSAGSSASGASAAGRLDNLASPAAPRSAQHGGAVKSAASGTAGGAGISNEALPPTTTPASPGATRQLPGAACTSGTAGCQNGKFTGNFFGASSGTSTPSATKHAGAPRTQSVNSSAAAASLAPALAPLAPPGQTVIPTPPSNGRQIVQSAQLQLLAASNRIDAVAQEVFQVVGNENGIVKSSSITAASGPGGYANFQLSIPSANLATTMKLLSILPYARVASRTDDTQDVTGAYDSDQRALSDARALRTSLLKQLAAAQTQEQINSLTAQIHDAEASISSDEATIQGLDHRINYSNLSVQINAGTILPVPAAHSSSSGFTLHKAAHDAIRVLTVAAGVVLIVLAALIPAGLVVALGLWVGALVRRRRREAALDAA